MEKENNCFFTDGSCLGNPGPGGWAVIRIGKTNCDHQVRKGGDPHTTNNRMELLAVSQALEWISEIHAHESPIVTDSRYVFDGVTKWIFTWRKNNWKKKDGSSVANKDLWKKVWDKLFTCKPKWQWTEAHTGRNNGNDLADSVAKGEAKLLQTSIRTQCSTSTKGME